MSLVYRFPIKPLVVSVALWLMILVLAIWPAHQAINALKLQVEAAEVESARELKKLLASPRSADPDQILTQLIAARGWKVTQEGSTATVIDVFDGSGVAAYSELLTILSGERRMFSQLTYSAVPGGSRIEIIY